MKISDRLRRADTNDDTLILKDGLEVLNRELFGGASGGKAGRAMFVLQQVQDPKIKVLVKKWDKYFDEIRHDIFDLRLDLDRR